jgi:BirA family biotin operon repressor/biotin-[acetyl-CoA-carboxylase] ligase
MEAGILQIDRLCSGLHVERVGRRIDYLESTTSTNDEAWKRIGTYDADGTVVLAEYQSAGRGRMGRIWESPRGASLLCSVLLIDEHREIAVGDVSLLSALAARDAIANCTDVTPTVKWPNDLMVGDRKLGGILIESRRRQDRATAWVIGIGINCLQQHGHLPGKLAKTATSLELVSKRRIDRTALAGSVLTTLDRWFSRPQDWSRKELRSAWLAHCDTTDRRVAAEHAGSVH